MIQTLLSWLSPLLSNPKLELGLLAFSVVAVLASIVLVPRFLASLPQDYLSATPAPAKHSMPLRLLRKLLGVVLVLLGLAMLLLPGQGLLTVLVGLLLLDFPGKHRLVVRLLGRPSVLKLVNKLRAHRGSPPLAT
jgi:Na+/H+ antiporter NhaD/arsenite permease-like protein